MKLTTRATVTALTLLAGAATAHATDVNLATIPGPVSSRGLLGAATNVTLTTPPVPAGGPWYFLTISGNLTKVAPNTRANEACIEVTTPNGDRFVIKPFSTGVFANTIAIPAGAATSPAYWTFGNGTCTLRFFELYADNASGPDATWSNLQIDLHDGNGLPMPFTNFIPQTPENPDTALAAQFATTGIASGATINFATTRVVDKMRIKGYGTAMTGWNSNSTASPLSFVRVNFTAPRADGGGDATWTVAPFTADATSSSSFDMVVEPPVPVLTGAGGLWTYTVTTQAGAPVNGSTTIGVIRFGVQPQRPDAPAATDLGIVRSRPELGPIETTPVVQTTYTQTPGLVKWYTFTTEHVCYGSTGYWLDIHTQIPAGSPITDHELALYGTDGSLYNADDDGGSDLRSMLSFGYNNFPTRPAIAPVSSPEYRDGHDGLLNQGLHYLAVSQHNATFGNSGWFATSTSVGTGGITLEIRTNLPAAGCGPADIGMAGGLPGGDGVLDNNDFIAFISYFFASNPLADVGIAGGLPGADGLFDNNDFIVFISQFFAGC